MTADSGSAGTSLIWPALGVSTLAHAALIGGALAWNPWAAGPAADSTIEIELVTRSTRSAASSAAVSSAASANVPANPRKQVDDHLEARHVEHRHRRAPSEDQASDLSLPHGAELPSSDLLRFTESVRLPQRTVEPAVELTAETEAAPRKPTPASTASAGAPALADPGADRRFLPVQKPSPPPAYPERALRQGWEGRVEVAATLDRTGHVVAVRLHRSSGHEPLDQAALQWVRKLSFDVKPLWFAERDRRTIRVPVRFDIVEE